ncbi:MAG: RNA polymerase subunit sigma [Verrucomicrobia bacterium]|nr:MAG: RNA polymerase subunit sigma [Verrucomicrobiota bacterium]
MTRTAANDATNFLPTRRSLLSRLKNADDQQGWQEFFDTYWRPIYGVARKAGLTEAEAEDAVQDVSKHVADFQYDPAKCSFKTWLLLLTRQRIARQFAKRGKVGVQAAARDTLKRGLQPDDTARTATIDRIPNPAGGDLEALWNDEWEKNVLEVAAERVKRQVKAEQYQMFDLYVLQDWPAREVARMLRVRIGQVYLAKYRVGTLVKKELKKLEQVMI